MKLFYPNRLVFMAGEAAGATAETRTATAVTKMARVSENLETILKNKTDAELKDTDVTALAQTARTEVEGVVNAAKAKSTGTAEAIDPTGQMTNGQVKTFYDRVDTSRKTNQDKIDATEKLYYEKKADIVDSLRRYTESNTKFGEINTKLVDGKTKIDTIFGYDTPGKPATMQDIANGRRMSLELTGICGDIATATMAIKTNLDGLSTRPDIQTVINAVKDRIQYFDDQATNKAATFIKLSTSAKNYVDALVKKSHANASGDGKLFDEAKRALAEARKNSDSKDIGPMQAPQPLDIAAAARQEKMIEASVSAAKSGAPTTPETVPARTREQLVADAQAKFSDAITHFNGQPPNNKTEAVLRNDLAGFMGDFFNNLKPNELALLGGSHVIVDQVDIRDGGATRNANCSVGFGLGGINIAVEAPAPPAPAIPPAPGRDVPVVDRSSAPPVNPPGMPAVGTSTTASGSDDIPDAGTGSLPGGTS